MESAGVIRTIANRPIEAIEFVIAVGLLISGIVILGPDYAVSESIPARIFDEFYVAYIVGILHIIIGSLWLYTLRTVSWPRRALIRRVITFTVFLLFFFYGAANIILAGLASARWPNLFIIALICAISHIRLRWGLK